MPLLINLTLIGYSVVLFSCSFNKSEKDAITAEESAKNKYELAKEAFKDGRYSDAKNLFLQVQKGFYEYDSSLIYIQEIDKESDLTGSKKESNQTKYRQGTITTIADGYDVQRVNLWSTTGSGRSIVGYFVNGDKVMIVKDEDPYYKVRSISNDNLEGYCMKGFVILAK